MGSVLCLERNINALHFNLDLDFKLSAVGNVNCYIAKAFTCDHITPNDMVF